MKPRRAGKGLRVVVVIALSACRPASPSPSFASPGPASIVLPVAPLPRVGAPTPTAPAIATSPTAFAAVRDRILDGLLDDEPSLARDLGLHAYDGRVAHISAEALAARAARLGRDAADLASIDPASLDADGALDRAELESWVATARFWLIDAAAPRAIPQTYEALFAVSSYVDRDYAPLGERASRLLGHEEAALAEVGHVRENLRPPLSKPVALAAARDFAGFATYLRGDVARLMGQGGDSAQRERFASVNEALAKAAAGLGDWLAEEGRRGDQSHVLGPARYAKLLRVEEGVTVSIVDLARQAEADRATNEHAYEAIAASVQPKAIAESQLFRTARGVVDDARRFVVGHAIVTLPAGDAVVVRETPPYERWSSASLEMSGPFEASRSAFYQLTLPDRAWPEAARRAYVGSLGDLLGTTVHEVYPGHFVQGGWAARAPTPVQKAFASASFVEGWAHYAEQMMVDEGFGAGDPATRLAMLHGALLRDCRFIASIGIHTQGMTVEQAEHLFTSACHQDAATAHEEAIRGTFDPGYYAYTLGKLAILALRDEAKRSLGSRFSLQRFHDALLAHGAPPLALVHDRVLEELSQPPSPQPR